MDSEKNGINDGKCEDLNKGGAENQTVSEVVVVLDSEDEDDGAAKTGGGTCCLFSRSSSSSSSVVYKRIPPFLLKIHDMLENNNEITNCSLISWRCNGTSFVITNPHLFADNVLPIYFRHNNFQSFIAQLNSYGFRKISWEHWEYSNEYFQKGKRHLLKNIKRRNQISPQNNPSSFGKNMEKEVEIMMNEHDLLKREIAELKNKQETLEQKLASLIKNQAFMINIDKRLEELIKSSIITNEDDDPIKTLTCYDEFGGSCSSDNNTTTTCNNLASIVEFMSEHGNKMPVLNEEDKMIGINKKNETNTLISLEDMFGERSDWVEYFKDLLEKAS